MHISRIMSDVVAKKMHQGKAIVLIGARQVGKTTLLKDCLKGQENVLWMNGDNLETRTLMANITVERYRSMLGRNDIVVIDEAQRIEDIGVHGQDIGHREEGGQTGEDLRPDAVLFGVKPQPFQKFHSCLFMSVAITA